MPTTLSGLSKRVKRRDTKSKARVYVSGVQSIRFGSSKGSGKSISCDERLSLISSDEPHRFITPSLSPKMRPSPVWAMSIEVKYAAVSTWAQQVLKNHAQNWQAELPTWSQSKSSLTVLIEGKNAHAHTGVPNSEYVKKFRMVRK